MSTEDYWRLKKDHEWWERKARNEAETRIRTSDTEQRAEYGYTGQTRRRAPASVALRAALLMVGFILVIELLSAGIQAMDSLSLGAVGVLAAILALALAKAYAQPWIRHVPPTAAPKSRRPTIPLLAGATTGGLVSLALNASGLTQPLVDLCRGLLAI